MWVRLSVVILTAVGAAVINCSLLLRLMTAIVVVTARLLSTHNRHKWGVCIIYRRATRLTTYATHLFVNEL